MKSLKLILSIIIIFVSLYLGQQCILLSLSSQANKKDYAELNHVKYGLFSIDKWKAQISIILLDEIDKLNITSTNEQELKKHVEVQLNILIEKINQQIKQGNKGSAEGWMKQKFIDIFININDIKQGIPGYADAIIYEMKKSKNKAQIKTLLNEKLELYLSQSFDTQDTSQLIRILKKFNSENIEVARTKLNNEIALKNELIARYALILILLSITLFVISSFKSTTLKPSQYILLMISLLILLTVGVATPMIDMEAKISRMSFVLLEHTVLFENQVLYFQTKSILDVFWIMITNEAIQMKLVGVLVVIFSIVFPLFKMASSMGYYLDFRGARKNRWIQFFVFKSGKWSMADVLVVAIFMAYIGFNGIITSQFGQLSSTGQGVVVLTTNGTSLQPGYYIFLSFTLLAMFLSVILARIGKKT